MAPQVSYPGVYVQEIPSGVRTLTGVPTSVAAFIGRTARGPVNVPVVINSFGDFERGFGGLWVDSTASFAVRDFFLNGGGQAVMVRLFAPSFADETARQSAFDAAESEAQTAADAIVAATQDAVDVPVATPADVAQAARDAVAAAGAAGAAALAAATAVAEAAEDSVAAAVALTDVRVAAEAAVASAVLAAANAQAPVTRARIALSGGLELEAANEGAWGNRLRARIDHDVPGGAADLFNLSVRDDATGQVEVFRNLSVEATHARRVDLVLANQSSLVRGFGPLPASRPPANAVVPAGGDPFADTNSTTVTTTASDGVTLTANDYTGSRANKEGVYALEDADIFNLLCIPPYAPGSDVENAVWTEAAAYCEERRAMLIVDAPSDWGTVAQAISGLASGVGTNSRNAALYFPRILQPNSLRDNQIEAFAPCGAVAGTIAATDTRVGVWKAPAGQAASLRGAAGLSVQLTNAENGQLNPLGINCLRAIPAAGRVIWGARTMQGDDRLASEWKYLPVRRTALFIEESLYRGLQWVVFEPNDEPLWAQIRLSVGSFMNGLFRKGAFQGISSDQAYFVKCDSETTTQADIDRGIVNISVGFAPLKPAEFVIIQLQQIAGETAA
ncbi:MAG: phage tail sheath subtilisin-like domain-containing protein [Halieaceae bacterium]|jgi:phage tail sheath protein FI|nr:phage tail sheath subtilisin-like domain-containing protein [Halieaceae bacterium]